MITFKTRSARNRATGKQFFTWTAVNKNGNIVNHKYNRKFTRDTMLRNFIEAIKKGNYTIE